MTRQKNSDRSMATLTVGALALATAITFAPAKAQAEVGCINADVIYTSSVGLITDLIMNGGGGFCSESEAEVTSDAFIRKTWGHCVYHLGSNRERSLLGVTSSNYTNTGQHHPYTDLGFKWGQRSAAADRVGGKLGFNFVGNSDAPNRVLNISELQNLATKCKLG